MAEDDPLVFDRISNWLYTGKVGLNSDKTYYERYVKVYAIAEKYGMVNLKNYLVGRLISRATYGWTIPPMDVVKYVYSTTPSNSPLRKLFVALYVWYMNKEFWASMVSSASLREVPDFAVDFALALGNKFLEDSLENSSFFQCNLKHYLEPPISMEGQQ